MATVTVDYKHIFDDVQFGIDLRAARKKSKLSQEKVGQMLGYTTATVISGLETGVYDQYLNMRDFVALCQIFSLHPSDYFDFVRVSGSDMVQGLEP